jgi:hypothetical protein
MQTLITKKLLLVLLLQFSVALAQTQLAPQPPQPWLPLAEMAP